jgi:hypothetical protein
MLVDELVIRAPEVFYNPTFIITLIMLYTLIFLLHVAFVLAAVQPIERESVFPSSNGSTPLSLELLESNP